MRSHDPHTSNDWRRGGAVGGDFQDTCLRHKSAAERIFGKRNFRMETPATPEMP